MRKNLIRKVVHGILDLLPLVIIPIFGLYATNKNATFSQEITVNQNKVVDFNQQLDFKVDTFSRVSLDFDVGKNYITLNGISDNSDFISISRDNSKELIQGHKYFLGFPSGSLNTYGVGILASGNYENDNSFTTSIFTASQTSNFSFMFVIRDANVSFTNTTINFLFTDLTQMYGSGNEPTINEFLNYYPVDNYSYTLSDKQLLKDVDSITYNDTDIGSQFIYGLYNTVDKYFNMNNVFNMNSVYDWFILNIFNGNASISIYIVWNIVLYEFVMDLLMLLYALFMFFIDMCKSLIEKPLRSIK